MRGTRFRRRPLTEIGVTLLAGVLAAAGALRAQEPAPPARSPTIAVTGTASVTLEPDHAVVQLSVVTRGRTAAEAGARNAEQVAAVLAALAGVGVDEDAVQTARYTVQPEFDRERGQRDLASYLAQNTVHATVDELQRVGAVIDAALAAGANDVASVQFGSRRSEEARRAALAQAVRAARLDAEAIAMAAGGRLGALEDVWTGAGAGGGVVQQERVRAATPTPVLPGELRVTATVVARWAFVPAP